MHQLADPALKLLNGNLGVYFIGKLRYLVFEALQHVRGLARALDVTLTITIAADDCPNGRQFLAWNQRQLQVKDTCKLD
ncbi:MAG: hypothetical protein OXF74_07030 [Rhodobacteraceae bacterium]|nr:hypothetical protein [Paracoccaceae bacterium]